MTAEEVSRRVGGLEDNTGGGLDRLSAWIASEIAGADEVRIVGHDQLELGHSAEMLLLHLSVLSDGVEETKDAVVKLRPPAPGLLEPYDLGRQFMILRALESTGVLAPRAFWHEPTGSVLGRELYVMERLAGDSYDRLAPSAADSEPDLIPRMVRSMVDQLAEVHLVDLAATGLERLGDGATFLERELERWAGDMRRVQRGPLPAMERLLDELQRRRPAPTARITLVHGDAKPGNFAFVGDAVSAVFDWEMTDIGDPMADIGYLELMWSFPAGLPSHPSAPPFDVILERHEERTGIVAHDRPWHLAFQAYKTAVILLIASMLFDHGHSDDLRYMEMGFGIDLTTQTGLHALGIDEALDAGPVLASDERIAEVQARATGHH